MLFRRGRRLRWSSWLIITIFIFAIFILLSGKSNRLYFGKRYQPSDDVMKLRLERFEKYQQSQYSRDGPGERGAAVNILDPEEKKRADHLYITEAFNIIASDKISLERSVRDVRDPECKKLFYPEVLPTASVVIIFHNEAWSPLLRTAHSVVNRSPPQYLHEIILLDDFSDRAGLGEELDIYVKDTWPDGVVKVVRTKQRSGLIRARLAGAEAATGDVLIFLDSHCEVGDGWLEPMLARIKEKRTAVLCPYIDIIDDKTMAFYGVGSGSVGGFWWSLHFSWRPMSQRERNRREHSTDPIRSPTMAGGLFAADRKFFFEIGSYDPGMDVWGGENLEISFRSWMCGGSLEFIPCSRVGHIFRSRHPYTFPGNKDTHGLNSKRLADVWMDDYKRLFYMHRKDLIMKDAGDIKERTELRKKLGCKSFKWYLENVYPEKFIPDENVYAYGMVKSETGLCLDTMGTDEKTVFAVGVYYCQGGASANEIFSLSKKDELRREEACMDASGSKSGSKVSLIQCHGQGGNQKWKYNQQTRQIIHDASGLCLDVTDVQTGQDVLIRTCTEAAAQRWTFQTVLEIPL